MTFVDVGANAGGYVWWVLSLLRHDCRILAVEPDPFLVASLRLNLDENHADNVQLAPVGVGTEAGQYVLVVDPENRGENRLEFPGSSRGQSITVRPLEDRLHVAGAGTRVATRSSPATPRAGPLQHSVKSPARRAKQRRACSR